MCHDKDLMEFWVNVNIDMGKWVGHLEGQPPALSMLGFGWELDQSQ